MNLDNIRSGFWSCNHVDAVSPSPSGWPTNWPKEEADGNLLAFNTGEKNTSDIIQIVVCCAASATWYCYIRGRIGARGWSPWIQV